MYRKIAVGSAVLFALGVLVGFVGFPRLMQKLIKSQMNLKPGSDTRKMWEKFPVAVNFTVYAFNVTNPEETQAGGKPHLQEIGPFVFEEWKDKYDIEDIEEEDAVVYNMRNLFKFRPDLGLSGEDLITMPHPIIQFTAISTKRDKAAMLPLVAQGLEVIFKTNSSFITAPFMDLFFRGIDVDCSNDHFAANAICLNFHSDSVRGGVKVNATHFKFSLMGANNYSDAGRFKAKRGIKDNSNLGQILQFAEEDELSNWNGDDCNRLRGTDATIFAPLMDPSVGLWTYTPDICRSLGPRMQKKVRYAGLPALRFTTDFGDVRNEPENQCFCQDYPQNCPRKGTMDLSPCNGLPMVASMPHFLNGNSQLLNDVDGLNPDVEKHGIFIDFEIISGTPLSLAKRLQFNLDVEPVEELAIMSQLRPLVMPLFWIEESLQLDKSFTDMLNKKIFLGLKANNAFKWFATVLGPCGLGLSLYMLYLRRKDLKIRHRDAQRTEHADGAQGQQNAKF